MIIQIHILDVLESRLLNMSLQSGYTIKFLSDSITRGALYPFRNGDLPAINYWTATDELVTESYGKQTRKLKLLFEAYTIEIDDNNLNTGYLFSEQLSRAITNRDIAFNNVVGCVKINTLTPIVSAEGDPWAGVLIDASVEYTIDNNDFNI